MARRLNLLSPKFIETIDRPGRYSDGGGLYLQVTAGRNGVTKCWLFRYMRGHVSRSGKPISREMGLGPLSTNKRDGYISTKEARDRAYLARESLKAGVDPLDAKRAIRAAQRLQDAKAVTFSNVLPSTSRATRQAGRARNTSSFGRARSPNTRSL